MDTKESKVSLDELKKDLENLRQNALLGESALNRFSRELGIPVFGTIEGEPSDFLNRGWISSDGVNYLGEPLFHPFRFYPIYKVLEHCKLNIAPVTALDKDSLWRLLEITVPSLPSLDNLREVALEADQIVEFAILLEPLYWPMITGKTSYYNGIGEHKFERLYKKYFQKICAFVKQLNPEEWHNIHEKLRKEARFLDGNSELYLLLRAGSWNKRERLKGKLGAALWLRHIAELIRRAFEEFYEVKWLEEDQIYENRSIKRREDTFGFERPLDNLQKARSYLTWNFGLFTGSVVRWYVEGETEYYAIKRFLPDASDLGIELVNLYGTIEAGKGNVAFKLEESLKQDKDHRRFSMISFDKDVKANIKAIQRQILQDNIVGYISRNDPDFEFTNFSIEELIEIVARIDEQKGVSADAIRDHDWFTVTNASDFEKTYKKISERRPRSLKGKEWGESLADYIRDNPYRKDTKKMRSFVVEIQMALRVQGVHYDFHKKSVRYNLETFELITE